MNYSEMKSLLLSAPDQVTKLELLMDIGKTLQQIPEKEHGTEIKGCASRVEIFHSKDNKFYATADSSMVSGIVALLLAMKSDGVDFSDISSLGLNLGASRLNGMASIIAYLKSI